MLPRTVKELADGRVISSPQAVAVDPAGNVLLVDGPSGLNTTLLLSPAGEWLQDLPGLETPSKAEQSLLAFCWN